MKKILLSASLVVLGLQAYAQGLNQQVEVSNDYRSSLLDVVKVSVPMQVPDSVTRFNLVYDYSVFDNPYKGAYEFTPYGISVTPGKSQPDAGRFFLRAGAGYTLNPVLYAVWNAYRDSTMYVNVVQDGRGYIGGYTSGFDGYDITESLRVHGGQAGKRTRLGFDATYDGIFTGDANDLRYGLHDVGIGFRMSSMDEDPEFSGYSLAFDYDFASDGANLKSYSIIENRVAASGSAGIDFRRRHKISLDAAAEFQSYSAASARTVSVGAGATPNYLFRSDRLYFRGGVKFTLTYTGSLRMALAPSVMFKYELVKDRLRFFLTADGGTVLDDYAALRRTNHWFNALGFAEAPDMHDFVSNSVAVLKSGAGFEGRAGKNLQFRIDGGYDIYDRTPLVSTVCEMAYAKFNLLHGDLSLKYDGRRFDMEALLSVRKDDGRNEVKDAYLPALFSADVSGVYNWGGRVFLGLSAACSTARMDLPSFLDLGASFEYRTTGPLSFWLRGGNLLGQDIQYVPMHGRKGPSITAGICLNLR